MEGRLPPKLETTMSQMDEEAAKDTETKDAEAVNGEAELRRRMNTF